MWTRTLTVSALLFFSLTSLLRAVPLPASSGCFVHPGYGSTLLFPYFETDLNDTGGAATLVSINNGQGDEALARVVLWTDWGNPTLAFDLYLPGFSVATFNLRDTFNGGVPSTGDGVDLSAFEFCDSLPPTHSNPALTSDEIAQLRADHTGQLGPLSELCAGAIHNDGIARGYITVDVVDECSGLEGFDPAFTPANTEYPYFADGDASGIGINDDRLWGDIFYLSSNQSSAHGSEAIPLWADAEFFAGGNLYTFYGRFSGWDGRDNRVPLPNLWNQRFINGGPFAGGADLIVYHDTGLGRVYTGCGSQPNGFPLGGDLFSLDDAGDNLIDLSSQFEEIGGLAAQRGSITALGIPYPFGWIQVDTNHLQSWVQPVLSASGVYSAALNGTPATFLCGETPPPALTTPDASLQPRTGKPSKAAQRKLRLKAEKSELRIPMR